MSRDNGPATLHHINSAGPSEVLSGGLVVVRLVGGEAGLLVLGRRKQEGVVMVYI